MCTYWNKVSFKRSTSKNKKRIDSIGIGLASPEEIRHWGERRLPNGTLVGKVEKDHTVDYESLKPIEGGLFCERIFGPVEDFYCSCERRGEKNEKFCPDCEVEFTKSRVRRTRMGYISLAVPVAHVWYLRGRPSYIANFIGKSRNTVDKLAYGETLCESFVGNTSTNYLKDGLEHLVESKKCRILNFDSSNLDLLLLSQKQELMNKQNSVSCFATDYSLFGWRSSYVKLLACKFALQGNVGFFLKNPKHENHRVDQGTVESRFIPATIKLQSNPDKNLPSSGHLEHGKKSLVKSSLASFKFPVIPEIAPVNGVSSTGTPLTGVPSTSFTNYVYELRNTINGFDVIKDDIRSSSQGTNGRLDTDEFASSQEFHQISDFNRIKGVDTARESSSRSENPFIEQVGITSPFLKIFVPVKENVSWVKPSGFLKNGTDKKSRRNILRNHLDSRENNSQSFFSIVEDSICFLSNQSKNQGNLGFKKSTQWVSQKNYPYKVEKNLLSSSQATYACEAAKRKGLLKSEKGVFPKGDQAQRVYNNSLSDISRNTFQGKYNKFHTLPIFSTFIYKEWSHRFSFLEYFIWSARENDLALPFYIRQGTCHMARINAMNLIRNQIGLEKTPKEFLFGFNNCFLRKKNTLWSQRQVCVQPNSNVLQQPSQKEFKGSKKNTDTVSNFLHSNSRNNLPFLNNGQALSKYFLELRDKRVSLALSISPPSQLKNSTAQRLSTPTIKQNSTPVPLIVPNSSIELVDPKDSLLYAPKVQSMNKQEKSLCVSRQIEKFFAWGSFLSSEKIAITNWFDFSGLQSRASSCTPGATVGTEEGLPIKGSYNSPKNSIDSSATLNKFVLPSDALQPKEILDSNIELKISSLRKKTASCFATTSFFSKAGCSGKEAPNEQATNSLASGNFQQLKANKTNKTQSTTSWQESSLMWGKVDDTQQFPRLSELLHFTGGTALRHLLSRFHLVLLGKFLRYELKNLELKINFLLALKMLTYSQGLLLGKLAKRRSKQIRRLKLLELFQSKKSNPEWMVLSVLPVLPPDLRPILRVNDDFVVASDLNRLYQTVLRRNNTIHERLDDPLPCPESGLFRQRSLQKAVDGLLENGKGGGTPLCASKRRPLVSLSHVLKGKKGLFRQHLLGKRVDYSGRSVIVVGPKLNLYECGLPKEMALELFQPFLIHRLKIKGLATSNTAARRMIQQEDPMIWHTVKQLVYEHPVLLNRAPTLHRLGIQAFQPRLVSGRAILLHPLVCNGFNADFDGDQMAVHVPLSFQARAEAWKIMWSKNNFLSPATGQPILVPSQDMVLGCYYLSVLIPRVACCPYPAVAPGVHEASPRTPCFFPGTTLASTETNEQAKKQVLKGPLSYHQPNNPNQAVFRNHVQPGFNNNSNLEHLNNLPSYPKDSELKDSFSFKENSQGNIHPSGFFKKTQHLGFLTDANLLEKKASLLAVPKKQQPYQITPILAVAFPKTPSNEQPKERKEYFRSGNESSCVTKDSLDTLNPKNHKKKDDTTCNFSNSTHHLKIGHYFSTLQDSLTAYSQGRLQTHTPFWVRLEYSITEENKDTTLLQERFAPPFLETTIVPVSKTLPIPNKIDVLLLLLLSKNKQSTHLEFSLLQPRYGCSQELCRTLFQEDPHKIVIEANETLEAPLELRLGADGNLVKILTTLQNHYSSRATLLDQYKEKSIRYMRTTAGRVVINKNLFH